MSDIDDDPNAKSTKSAEVDSDAVDYKDSDEDLNRPLTRTKIRGTVQTPRSNARSSR
ncbi:hypothetical protein V7S43_004700 [Phytophthora oleae]|uniref:Uncharacterized protein n=1 Tax=Phytophthora oleae TaxID=2107226 RepID=A0ABD3FXL7_9STRA